MADINDILEGGEADEHLNLNDLDEKEVLGDEDEEELLAQQNGNGIAKQEADDLYDEAMAPSGVMSEKRESAEIQSSLPLSSSTNLSSAKALFTAPTNSAAVFIKTELGYTAAIGGGSQTGKRYCCYIGNMTWWTTDDQLTKMVQALGVEDLVDIKFYENRNNGQSKGFALAVFASEPSVKTVMEKLNSKKLHEQQLVVLPYTKQSLAKLEEATKRYDQKGQKEEKVVNIGTVRIGANGAPVQQLMSSINLTHLARPGSQQQTAAIHQPTSLLALNFPAMPVSRPQPTASAPAPAAVAVPPPPGTTNTSMLTTPPPPVATPQQQQQQIVAAQQQQQHNILLQQQQQRQQQQQQLVAAAASSQQQQLGLGISVPPPNIVAAHQQHAAAAAAQAAALQSVMSRPPPAIHQSIGASMHASAPPPVMTMAAAGGLIMGPGGYIQQQQPQMQPQQMQQRHMAMQQQMGMAQSQQQHQQMMVQQQQAPAGFPPGAHINPQVYPGFAGGYMDNGGAGAAMMSEAEFQDIMNRNQTVSSSAIHRAVSDAAGGDYASAIETLVTAISLIRQSRVAHDDRCKLLVNTLQDTLKGIENQSYAGGGGGGISRKHRVRDRSRSPVRSSKRHRRSRSRSRSRDYSPMRYAAPSSMSSRRY